jgi:hypothetical protein
LLARYQVAARVLVANPCQIKERLLFKPRRLFEERKATARMKGKGVFSTAENQDSFIVRIFLKGVVEQLVERKGFNKGDHGERV